MSNITQSTNTELRNSTGNNNYLQFTTSPSGVPVGPAILSWNIADGCLDIQQYNGTTLQAGQELNFYGKASGNIANGDICQFAGVQGNHILIKKAVAAEIIAHPEYFVGVATDNILNGGYGYTTWFGKINGVYTKTPSNQDSADWVEGDLLFFSNSTGQLTKIAPVAPELRILVAAVIKQQTGSSESGIIIVRPSFGIKMMDCDDVNGGVLDTTGQFLVWDQINKYFDPTVDFTIDETSGTPTIKTTRQSAKDLHIFCGMDKTVVLDESVYTDIDFPIVIRTTGTGQPVQAPVLGNLTMPQWQVNDYNVCEIQEIVHSWEEGSTINWHIHILTAVQDATDRYLNWEIEFNYANIYVPSTGGTYNATQTWQASNTVITSGDSIIPANTPARTNIIIPISTWAYTAGKIGAHVKARLKRIALVGAGSAPSVNPFCEMLQMHIYNNTLGSRQIGTK